MAMNVLIVKLSSLSDVIHTLPAALAVRAAAPDAHLAWAVRDRNAEILRNQPWLDEVIEWRGGWRSAGGFLRRLRGKRWDVAIDFQGRLRSGAITRLSGARRRIGYEPSLELAHAFYSDPVALQTMDRHAVEQNLTLAWHFAEDSPDASTCEIDATVSVLGPGRQATSRFPLHPRPDDLAAVDAWCRRHRFDPRRQQLVVLLPHATRPAHRWPTARFVELARRLLVRPQVRVALSGGAAAAKVCDEIARADDRLWRADGWFNVLAHAALFERASVVVGGDTGLLHVAAAVDAPLVALLGASNPLRTAPYSANATVLHHALPCSPCLARRCPLDHAPLLCMASIEVEQVLEAVAARLDEPQRLKKSA